MPGSAAKLSGRMAALAKIRTGTGEILPLVKEQMLLDSVLPGDRNISVLHVSDLVHKDTCSRAVTARILGLELPGKQFSFQRENVFDEGNTIHRKWQQRMRRTLKLQGQWKCLICGRTEPGYEPGPYWKMCIRSGVKHLWEYDEIPLYWEPLLLSGHADGGIGTAIIEIKSVGAGTLRYEAPSLLAANTIRSGGRDILDLDQIWADIKRPFPSHIRQGNLYCWLAAQLGMPYDHMVFLYECKWNQQVREFTIEPSAGITAPLIRKAAAIAAAVRDRCLPACAAGGCSECEGTDAQDSPATAAGRHSQQAGSPHTARAGDRRPGRRMVPAAARRPAADPGGPARTERPRADGPVPAAEQLAQAPADPGGDGRSRRVRRRETGAQQRGDSTGQEHRQDSSGNESPRPRRRTVHRGGGPAR